MSNMPFIGQSKDYGAFIQSREKMPRIFKTYTRLAVITSLAYPTILLLLGKVTTAPADLLLSYLPAVTCLIGDFLIRNNRVDATWLFMFVLGPVSVFGRYLYGTVNGVQLIVLFTAILSFFLVARCIQVITGYLISIAAFCGMHILLAYRTPGTSPTELGALCLGLLAFSLLLFYILFYLRGVMYKYHRDRTDLIYTLRQTNKKLDERNEEIFRQLNQLSEKNRIISNAADFHKNIMSILSHDVKESILPIKYLVHGYQSGKFKQEDFSRYFQLLSSEIDRMQVLFEEILGLAAIPESDISDHKSEIDLFSLVDEVVEEFSMRWKEKNITIKNETQQQFVLYSNKKILKIIFRNLVSNAVKFSYPNSEVRISGDLEDTLYHVSVEDSGIGISSEDVKRILSGKTVQRLGTSNEKGTGLGLQFCRDFISRVGGSLNIVSVYHKGTTISFTIPVTN